MPETPIAPSGPITEPFRNLAQLISQSTTFQTMVAAANADDALEKIDWPFWDVDDDTQTDPENLNHPVPGCTVTQLEGMQHDIFQDGTVAIELLFELRAKPRDDLDNRDNQWKDFSNTIGAILTEMFAKHGQQAGNVMLPEINGPITTSIPPSFTDPDDDADENSEPFIMAAFTVQIGV